jgi:acyl carrier protein
MSDREDILHSTREILRRQLRNPGLDLPEAQKLRDLAADSLDLIEIVFVIEEHFGIDLPPPAREGGGDLTPAIEWSLGDLVDWISARCAAGAPP